MGLVLFVIGSFACGRDTATGGDGGFSIVAVFRVKAEKTFAGSEAPPKLFPQSGLRPAFDTKSVPMLLWGHKLASELYYHLTLSVGFPTNERLSKTRTDERRKT